MTKKQTCYSEAIKHLLWREAMNAKFDALLSNETWSLVPKPSHTNLVGCKQVYKVEGKADSDINIFKACLVAKGFHQYEDVCFGETFSTVVKPNHNKVGFITGSFTWLASQAT